jgi:hypothetical protein
LVSCGKAPPPDPLSWRARPEVLAEFSNRNNYPISTRKPVIRGKLVVIDMTDDRPGFRDYYFYLKDLLPHSKEEVGTIAWIRHFRTAVGKYSDGHTGYQETCEVTIVDNIDKQAIWTEVFQGGMPQKEYTYKQSERADIDRAGFSGGHPDGAVIQYLKTLPRQ